MIYVNTTVNLNTTVGNVFIMVISIIALVVLLYIVCRS